MTTDNGVDLRLELLGPIRVIDQQEIEVKIERPAQRRLLSVLAISAGQWVSTEVLIDRLWPDGPPTTARAAFHTHMSGLRRRLGDGVVVTEGRGYRLILSDHLLDVNEFVSLASVANSQRGRNDWDSVLDTINAALASWRGEPFEELADDDSARPQIVRLRELRLELLELRAESLIALNLAEEALPDLEALVLEHPLRERLWEHLMNARYRLGRHTEALRAYREISEHLAEIGVEPGQTLRRLEERILVHDPLLASTKNNLPFELDSFIGRERELARAAKLLADNRLVTLTGAGGSGKTRLAIHLAHQLLDRYPDGVWYVELANLDDPRLIPAEVAQSIGVKPSDDGLIELVANRLEGTRSLLILDNCEHLDSEPARVIDMLLRNARDLKVLATSRSPLRVAGEVISSVAGLNFPAAGDEPEGITGFDAVRLFQDRAAQAGAFFSLTSAEADTVGSICRRLDGMPLAIELAAARVASLSLVAVDELLDDRFRLLTTGSSTAPTRHQTLEASIDWSYQLLSPGEQEVLRSLAVFRGGFDLEMAERIFLPESAESSRVSVTIGSLVEHSLVTRYSWQDLPRYRLLESVREFATRRFEESGHVEQVRERHRDWCVGFSLDVWDRIHDPGRSELLDRIHVEFDNLMVAFNWSEANGDSHEAGQIASGAVWHWDDLEYLTRSMELLEQAILSCKNPRREAEMRAASVGGYFHSNQPDRALEEATRAYEYFRREPATPAKAYAIRGYSAMKRLLVDQDPSAAVPLSREAVRAAVEAKHSLAEIRSRKYLAMDLAWNGSAEEALTELRLAEDLLPVVDDSGSAIEVYLAGMEVAIMIPGARRTLFKYYADKLRELGEADPKVRSRLGRGIAWAYLQAGDWETAEHLVSPVPDDRHLEGYDRLNLLFTRSALHWMRGQFGMALADLDEAADVGINPRWYHDYYPFLAEIKAAQHDIEGVRFAARSYLEAEVHGSEEARKLAVLYPLVRAAVDQALQTSEEDRPAFESEASDAVTRMRSILDVHPPPGDGSNTLEIYATYLAFAGAELSRLNVSDPELWRRAFEQADFMYNRLYAQWRMAEAKLQAGEFESGNDELQSVVRESKRVGARFLVDQAEATAEAYGIGFA